VGLFYNAPEPTRGGSINSTHVLNPALLVALPAGAGARRVARQRLVADCGGGGGVLRGRHRLRRLRRPLRRRRGLGLGLGRRDRVGSRAAVVYRRAQALSGGRQVRAPAGQLPTLLPREQEAERLRRRRVVRARVAHVVLRYDAVAPPEEGEGGASPIWVDVQKLCNMCVLSLSWNFFVSHDKYIAKSHVDTQTVQPGLGDFVL